MFVMELQLRPPLLPLCLAYPLCPPCLMRGVFSNCKYGCGTSKLLMVAARMHMARLSSYPVRWLCRLVFVRPPHIACVFIQALGYRLVRGVDGTGFVYTHPMVVDAACL